MWIHVRFVSWILNLQSTKLAVLAAPAGDTFLKSPYNPFWKNCGWLELNQIKAIFVSNFYDKYFWIRIGIEDKAISG